MPQAPKPLALFAGENFPESAKFCAEQSFLQELFPDLLINTIFQIQINRTADTF
jgi:hypothetical protein